MATVPQRPRAVLKLRLLAKALRRLCLLRPPLQPEPLGPARQRLPERPAPQRLWVLLRLPAPRHLGWWPHACRPRHLRSPATAARAPKQGLAERGGPAGQPSTTNRAPRLLAGQRGSCRPPANRGAQVPTPGRAGLAQAGPAAPASSGLSVAQFRLSPVNRYPHLLGSGGPYRRRPGAKRAHARLVPKAAQARAFRRAGASSATGRPGSLGARGAAARRGQVAPGARGPGALARARRARLADRGERALVARGQTLAAGHQMPPIASPARPWARTEEAHQERRRVAVRVAGPVGP